MKWCIIPALLILSGCCKPTPMIIYPPAPPKMEMPALRYKALNKDTRLADLTVALTLDVLELEATLKKALEYLKGVQPPAPAPAQPKR